MLLSCSSGNEKAKTDTLISTVSADTPAVFHPDEMLDGIQKLELLRSGFIIRQSYDSLAAMYAPNCRVAPENGSYLTGPDAVVAYWKNYDGINMLSRSSISVEGTPDLLYETGVETCQTRGTERHDRLFWNYKYLVIWKRNADNSWQIVSEMWNRPER